MSKNCSEGNFSVYINASINKIENIHVMEVEDYPADIEEEFEDSLDDEEDVDDSPTTLITLTLPSDVVKVICGNEKDSTPAICDYHSSDEEESKRNESNDTHESSEESNKKSTTDSKPKLHSPL